MTSVAEPKPEWLSIFRVCFATDCAMLPLLNLIVVVPEILNLILLVLCCVKIYQAIEVGHPVFGLLFANLICATIFSALGVLSFLFLADDILIRGKANKVFLKMGHSWHLF